MKRFSELKLSWQTDHIFARFDAELIERDDYLVVRTAQNPHFYWGNYLLFDQLPSEENYAKWHAAFTREISGPQPLSKHVAFGLELPAGAVPVLTPSFMQDGFELIETRVMTLTRTQFSLQRAGLDQAAEVLRLQAASFRAVNFESELDLLVDAQCSVDAGRFEAVGYRAYRVQQMRRYAAMNRAGYGSWFALWQGGLPVADCGLYRDPSTAATLARFQSVGTLAAYRRRGLCNALVRHVCAHAFDQMGVDTLVMCADPVDVAIGIYRNAGFVEGNTSWGLQRLAPADAAARLSA